MHDDQRLTNYGTAQDEASANLDEDIAASPQGMPHGKASVEGSTEHDPLADLAVDTEMDTHAKDTDKSSVYNLRMHRQEILERDSFTG